VNKRTVLFCLFLTSIFWFADLALAGLDDATFNSLKESVKEALKNGNAAKAVEGINKLSEDNSLRLVEFLFNLSAGNQDKSVIQAIASALRKVSDQDALAYIARNARAAREELRPVLAEILGSVKTEEALNALVALLADGSAETVREAAKAIAKRQESRAVDALIDALSAWEKKDEATTQALKRALIASSGKPGEGLETAQDWRNFWVNSGGKASDAGEKSSGSSKPSFFGTTLSSSRFVFIIDISGSMTIADPSEESGASAASEGKTTPTDEAKKQSAEEKTRIGRTKRELINVINAVSRSVKFNIIAFNDEVKSWKTDMMEASDENKRAAIEFVKGLTAQGLTYTDDALREAFKNESADTFILLSDGAPTHEGGEARPEWDGHKDSKEVIERIYKEVKQLNSIRRVRIDTFGFPDANFEFMKKLAEENDGVFSKIK
jgi:hypothetical protein